MSPAQSESRCFLGSGAESLPSSTAGDASAHLLAGTPADPFCACARRPVVSAVLALARVTKEAKPLAPLSGASSSAAGGSEDTSGATCSGPH